MRTAVFLHCRARLSFAFRPHYLVPPPYLLGGAVRSRAFCDSKEDTSDIVRERARSTAEEFTRQAKEKLESVAERAKEAWDTAKETVTGEPHDAKEKPKEKVEKGNYNKIGRD